MFSKKKKKTKEILTQEEVKTIKIKKKESPLNKIPNDVLVQAIKDIMKK